MPVIQQQPPMVVQGIPVQGMQGLQINGTLPLQTAATAQTLPRIIPVQANILGTAGNVQTLQAQPAATAAAAKIATQKPGHIPLARCRVLYLGSAVPLDTSHGIDAVQGPCRERYPFESGGDVNGIDSWVSVFSSGMLLSYVNDKKGNTWFPIQSLYVCAAVKCVITVDGVTGDKNARFVSLDSEEAKTSKHPPMFACIMRRTKGVKVLECHVFICKSTKAAMALVQSCTHAYEHKEGWTDEPPSLVTKPNAPTRLIAAEGQEGKNEDSAPPEFYKPPPAHGYYYTSDKELVKNYNVFGGEGKEDRREEDQDTRRQPAQQAAMPPPGAPGGPMPPAQYYPQQGPPGGPPMPVPMMPAPGMFPFPMYPMPPPPPGYFNDWDQFEGRPIAVFDDYDQRRYPPPPPMGPIPMGPPPPMREPEPPRMYRDERPRERGPPFRDDYRRDDYRPPMVVEEYRPPPPRDVYRRESPPRERMYRRGRSPSPRRGREEIIHEERYRGEPAYDRRRARTPPADYRDRYDEERYHGRDRRGGGGDRYYTGRDDDTPSDLVLYAPQYRRRFPANHSGGGGGRDRVQPPMSSNTRRVDRGDYVQYTSNFTPDVVMKGSKDFREGSRNPRGGYARDDDDPYQYERSIIRDDDRRYPRQERGFGKSLQEERETIGDNYSDRYSAYRQNDLDTESANIDYGYFRGAGRDGGQQQQLGPNGRPYDDLEDTLGYYP